MGRGSLKIGKSKLSACGASRLPPYTHIDLKYFESSIADAFSDCESKTIEVYHTHRV